MKSIYVQFGCGLSAPENWLNFDVSPLLRLQKLPLIGNSVPSGQFGRFPRNILYGDVVKGLPIPDNSVELLYCSHVLEHLSLHDLRQALRNCYRSVRKDGLFRMVLPDLEWLAQQYIGSASTDAALEFMQESYLGKHTRERNLITFLREWLGGSHHLWMWDYKSLSHELNAVGFKTIRRAKLGDSSAPQFAEVEDRGRWENALGIQCSK